MDYSDTPNRTEVDYERISYGKSVYKRVQRLRKKGRRRNIEVPYLNYELSKPEKPRILFWIVAIISAVIFVGILVGIGFLVVNLLNFYADLNDTGAGELIQNLFNPEYMAVSLGITFMFGLFLSILIYGLALGFVVLAVSIALYFYRFVRDAFYMATCSKEEFAKGNIVSSRIFGIITIIVVVTVLFIIGLIYLPAVGLILGLIYGGLLIALGSLLALMIIEKKKCGKWFESLDEAKKQNYLAHDGALRKVKSRMRVEKSYRNDFWQFCR